METVINQKYYVGTSETAEMISQGFKYLGKGYIFEAGIFLTQILKSI
jgi:hypothetical protein